MSIIDSAEKLASGIIGGAEDVVGLAKRVWDAFKLVWWFLTHVGQLLDEAWVWLVHGVEWFGEQLDHLAGETFGTLWNLVTHVVPSLAAWAYTHSIGWAWKEIVLLEHAVHKFIDDVIKWAGKALHDLEKLLLGWVHKILHWAHNAVWWVAHRAETVWHLLTHPAVLAELLAAHIVWPVVRWFLKAGAHVVVSLLKQAASRGSEVEHLLEDVIHDML